VALGWQVYLLRHSSYDLGLVGLALFLPAVLFAIPAGVAADRIDRRRIGIVCLALHAIALIAIALLAARGVRSPLPYFVATAFVGTAQAWLAPALRSMLPMLVAPERYVRAWSFASATGQLVVIAGPALGGLLLVRGTPLAFGCSAALLLGSLVATLAIRLPARALAAAPELAEAERAGLRYALEGVRFIFRAPVVLGAITLDLFAVLFGGATALLPVYADAILHVGANGLGLLRSAPAVGAALVGAWLARHPLQRRAGRRLFATVAGFGVATIVFAYARSLWLSLLALAAAGGFDMVSMAIRSALISLGTPDPLRGRVNAVENVFIGASNELGAFESGMLAGLTSATNAVALGGIGTLAVTGVSWFAFAALRRRDALAEPLP